MTSNREKRAFWQFVLMIGLGLLVIPLFGDGTFMTTEYAAGLPLTIAALFRLHILRGHRRMVLRGH